MNRSKGLAVRSLLITAAAFLTIALIGGALTVGSLGEKITEGANILGDKVDFTIDVEKGEEGQETFSDLMKYTYYRASNDGCKDGGKLPTVPQQNKGEIDGSVGFPGLKDSYLGETPPCAGSSGQNSFRASNEKDPQTFLQEQGYDMEGTYSREQFEVTSEEPIVLDMNHGDTWGEEHLLAVSEESFQQSIMEKCERGILVDMIPGLSAITEARHIGTGGNFVVTFVPEGVASQRVDITVQDRMEDRLYCTAFEFNIGDWNLQRSPVGNNFGNTEQELKLCPGDRGYMQMNKFYPTNTGEANEESTGGAYNYPYIEITSVKSETC